MKPARKIGMIALALLVAIVAIAAFRVEIGTALYRRAASARVGHDALAGLPDGLRIALCGTGSPMADADRAGPCTLVVAGHHVFLFDAGEASARNLTRMSLPAGRIEGVFLTHFHSDHIDGLGPVMLMRWVGGAWTTPLPVHGPPGVEHIVAGFDAAYATDAGYRVAHHGARILPPSGAGGVAVPFALPTASAPVVVFAAEGVHVTAFAVDHGPVHPAVGYRIDYKGRSVVLSGDTRAGSPLVAAARGADVMVHEALQPALVALLTDTLVARGQPNMAQITRDIDTYHSTPAGAADDATAAGVRMLVLSHLIPPLPSRIFYPAFLGDAAQHFAGPIVVGEDGMMFDLLPGTTAIERHRLL